MTTAHAYIPRHRIPLSRHAAPPVVKVRNRKHPVLIAGGVLLSGIAAGGVLLAMTGSASPPRPAPPVSVHAAAPVHNPPAALPGTQRVTQPAAAASSPPAPAAYTVAAGDSLARIAERRCNGSTSWGHLYSGNRAVIGSNPFVLQPGMELKLTC